MDATVLIATYNRARILGEAIEAMLAQQTPPGLEWELLIVDNNSRDHTRAVVESYVDASRVPVRYLFESRQGKSHALNTGLGRARGAVVAFTDDDVLVPPDWLATGLRVLARWGADGGGGRILPKWEMPPPAWLASNTHLRNFLALMEVETPAILQYPLRGEAKIFGANMVLRRSIFDRVGLFDVDLGPNGTQPVNFEDVDMVERALRDGCKVVYDPELVVHHRIPPERMRMGYFRRWVFVGGRAAALRSPIGPGRFPLFGRPLWLYRQAASLLGSWLMALLLRRSRALDRQMDLLNIAGRLWWYPTVARQLRRRRKDVSSAGPPGD
jgi:glycosyltransferase involved in cell wall biosynthesis